MCAKSSICRSHDGVAAISSGTRTRFALDTRALPRVAESGRRADRGTREITLDELLVLVRVLEVPPLQLIAPLNAGEKLEVLPGAEMDALELPAWIAEDPPGELLRFTSVPVPGYTERMLWRGDPSSVLTIVRQLRIVTSRITEYGASLADPALREKHPDMVSSQEEEALRVMADRLMHLAARMAALGYDPPGLDPAREILKRHGLPSTLEEWRERAEVDNPPEYGDDKSPAAELENLRP